MKMDEDKDKERREIYDNLWSTINSTQQHLRIKFERYLRKQNIKSLGEIKCQESLEELGINEFISEFILVNNDKDKFRKFDFFALYDNVNNHLKIAEHQILLRILIEFDGKQHFIYSHKFFEIEEEFEKYKEADKEKTLMAIRKDYMLIRIYYEDEEDILHHFQRAISMGKKVYFSRPDKYSDITKYLDENQYNFEDK